MPPFSFRKSQSAGFSLLELLVAVVMSTAILGVSLGLIVTQRRQYLNQQATTDTAQTLQSGMETIGNDIRQAGEQIGPRTGLPVLRLIDGAAGAPDQLQIQRKLLAKELNVCRDVIAGTPDSITVADKLADTSSSDCGYSDGDANGVPDDVQEWRTFRCQQDGAGGCLPLPPSNCQQVGGSDRECTWAYLYDPANGRGEFFIYTGERPDPTNPNLYQIQIQPIPLQATFSNSYSVAGPAGTRPKLYLLEQRQYSLSDPNAAGDRTLQLQLIDAQNNVNYAIVNRLRDFQVQGLSATGWIDRLNAGGPPTDNWQSLQSLKVSLMAANTGPDAAAPIQTFTSQFYPRNSLSRP
jgi:type II secretory pathway pseudopilin PulG